MDLTFPAVPAMFGTVHIIILVADTFVQYIVPFVFAKGFGQGLRDESAVFLYIALLAIQRKDNLTIGVFDFNVVVDWLQQ